MPAIHGRTFVTHYHPSHHCLSTINYRPEADSVSTAWAYRPRQRARSGAVEAEPVAPAQKIGGRLFGPASLTPRHSLFAFERGVVRRVRPGMTIFRLAGERRAPKNARKSVHTIRNPTSSLVPETPDRKQFHGVFLLCPVRWRRMRVAPTVEARFTPAALNAP
jgi:hypothetical protein